MFWVTLDYSKSNGMIVFWNSIIPQRNGSLSLIDSMLMMVPLNLAKVIQQIVKIYFTLALNGLGIVSANNKIVLMKICCRKHVPVSYISLDIPQ